MKTTLHIIAMLVFVAFVACQEQSEVVEPQTEEQAQTKERRSAIDDDPHGGVEYEILDAFLWTTEDGTTRTVQVVSEEDYEAITTQGNICEYYPERFISGFNDCVPEQCLDCMATIIVTTDGVGAPWE